MKIKMVRENMSKITKIDFAVIYGRNLYFGSFQCIFNMIENYGVTMVCSVSRFGSPLRENRSTDANCSKIKGSHTLRKIFGQK